MATLAAAVLVLLTALNLVLNLIGSSGPSIEEGAAIVAVGMFLLIANFANKERDIPELTSNIGQTDVEAFDTFTTMRTDEPQTQVNPTTASILTSILGEQTVADQEQVNSAIDTLSSGEFGASVRQTLEAVEAANQTTNAQREALPADEETGQTLERVLVKPVPLPGQDATTLVDPSTIPGLEPNRKFVTSGVSSVPLPKIASEPAPAQLIPAPEPAPAQPTPAPEPAPAQIPHETTPNVPELPDLPDLSEPPTMLELPQMSAQVANEAAEAADPPPAFDLPDLEGLFEEEAVKAPASKVIGLPDLPDLDDLF